MKASPRQQRLLLELQTLDHTVTRVVRRRSQLPERAELAALGETGADVRERFMRAQRALEDLRTELDRLAADVRVAEERRLRTETRLQASSSGKEAQALQDELDTLQRRIGTLEDRQLELMEQIEEAEAAFGAAESEVDGLNRRRAELEATLARTEQDLDEERAVAQRARADLAAEVQGDVLAVYERIRERTGVGAARLNGRVSEGSNMELDAADLAAVAALNDDDVFFCPVSGAILVREEPADA